MQRKSKRLKLIVLSGLAISLLFFYWYGFVFSQGDPSSPAPPLPGTNFQVCTGAVDQDACYTEDSSITRLNWNYSSPIDPVTGSGGYGQMAFWIQVDDNGNLDDGNFPSPEIDTGWIIPSGQYYDILYGFLNPNTTYSWKVAVADANGSWSGWTCADTSFTTVPRCNSLPTAINLNVVKGDYCATPAHYLYWTYSDQDGDDESKFRFQVDDDNDFSSPEINRTRTGVWPDGSANAQWVIVVELPTANRIVYNTTYYWRVKVFDDQGANSGWIEGSSFMTEEHPYPFIDFNWSPIEPSQDEDVLFADQSEVYGGSTKSAWAWTFTNGNPASSSQQNPTIQFTADGPKEVTLQVTDSDNFSCQISKSVGVQAELPGWQEILPQ